MSEKLPTRKQALRLLRESGCSENVIKHCEAVAELAVEIAENCINKGIKVDLKLVEIGALLHDIGRSKTHSVHHAVAGAQIAQTLGLPEPIIAIIKRHVGGGITAKEARKLGWPKDVYTPQTIEEKIIAYADKLIEGARRVPIDETLKKLSNDGLSPSAIARIQMLHEEMSTLIGDCECLP
ncbi:MAG: TIGR00295 family protein [Candidatus Bathyarchaeia archaeon]